MVISVIQMKVRKSEVKTYIEEAICECGAVMERSPVVKTSYPPIYTYECDTCGRAEESNEELPKTFYSKV